MIGLAGQYSLETLLGWPVTVRTVREMESYSAPLRPRTVVILIGGATDSPAMIADAANAKSQGATVWIMTEHPHGELARKADGLIPICTGKLTHLGIQSNLCKHAALSLLALTAAQILKSPRDEFEQWEREFRELPCHIEKLLLEKSDASHVLGEKLRQARSLLVLGGGFYFPVALTWAHSLKTYANLETQVSDLMELDASVSESLHERIHPLVVLSGSRSPLRNHLQIIANQMENTLCEMIVISDARDQQMVRRASLALLIPTLSDLVGSLAMLATLHLATYYAARWTEGEKHLRSPLSLEPKKNSGDSPSRD